MMRSCGSCRRQAYDLDALPLADREVVHGAIRIDRQSVARGYLGYSPLQIAPLHGIVDCPARCSRRRFNPSKSEKCWNTTPMPSLRARPVRDLHGFSLPDDLTRVRPQDAVDDVDERALAGAVLAEERVNRARPHAEPDIVVCKAGGESLDDTLSSSCGAPAALPSFTPCGAPALPDVVVSVISRQFCRASPTTPETPDALPRSRTGRGAPSGRR